MQEEIWPACLLFLLTDNIVSDIGKIGFPELRGVAYVCVRAYAFVAYRDDMVQSRVI